MNSGLLILKSNAIALLLSSVLAPSLVQARQLPPPSPLQCSCPVGYIKVGMQCVKTRPPACPAGMSLKVNAQGLIDRCFFNPPKNQKPYPTHPAGVKNLKGWSLVIRNGVDRWEKRLPCAPWKSGMSLLMAPTE